MSLSLIMRVVLCAALVAVCVAGAGWFPTQPVAGQETKHQTLHGAAALEQLKKDGQYESLQAAMQQARFGVSLTEQTPLGRAAWHAPNPAAGYDAYVTEAGVSIAVNDKTIVSLSLSGIGYGEDLQSVGPGEISGDNQTINLTRYGGVREWYFNGPDGLEHGFTLSEPPGAQRQGAPLRLALRVSKGWQAVASEDDQLVSLRGGANQVVEYCKLVVRDKLGRNIPARLAVADEQVVIEVEDHDATYPLTIDPLFTLQQKLAAADGAKDDEFGSAVALSGNTAVVGAPSDDVTHTDQGTAYVFVRNGATQPVWTQQARLNALDGAAYDNFGFSVALSGDTLVVGAPSDTIGANEYQGSAYVFTRSGAVWTQQQKLIASDGGRSNEFGVSVALGVDTVVVGAGYGDIGKNINQGLVYVFTRSGAAWTQQQKLAADDGAGDDNFGAAVALDGDTLVVGAWGDGIGANQGQGSAYVFTRSGAVWTQQQKLTANDGTANDNFGRAVALGGDTLVVGAYSADIGANENQGAAYVFTRSGATWTLQQKLTASDGAVSDEFGNAVALDGDTLVVGAYDAKIGANRGQGSAYVFMRSGATWTQQRKLFAADGQRDDIFGYAIALHRDTVLVGAFEGDASIADQGTAYVFVVRDDRHIERQKLTAHDGAANDYFGTAVALDGDTLAVGAYSDDIGANQDQGSVYVFTCQGATWTLQQKLTASDGAAKAYFGYAVALSGATLMVGAHEDDFGANGDQGSAYVFTRNGAAWTQQQKLNANDGAANDFFGWAVALSGDIAVVGATVDDNGTIANQGSAYVFTRNGAAWAQQQKLTANDGAASDFFGAAVALSGDTVVVGSPADNVGVNADQGSAYVFTRSGAVWTQQQKLTASDGAAVDNFGYTVALSGDTAVVGAPYDDNGANGNQGSAYVFTRNGAVWTQQAKVTANDGAANDFFGWAVALSGDTLALGASGDTIGTSAYQGSAYVFTRGGAVWTQQQKLSASDGAASDFIGGAVALSGDTIAVGARLDDIGGNGNQGSVYVFVSPPCPALTLAPDSLPDGAIGASYQQAVTVSGGEGTYQFALAGGALPPGLTLAQNGLLSGTPMTPGAYHFTVSATNLSSLCSASHAYNITITPSCPTLTLGPPALPSGTVGAAYLQPLSATGGTGLYSFRVSAGALPAGLVVGDGALVGTPTQVGLFNFTVRATDANGCQGARAYTLTINAAAVACVSAASYKAGAAPESIVAAFGVQMATQTQAAASLPLPTELAGVRVRVRDSLGVERLAPLFFVSPGQINFQIPAGTATGMATISVSNGSLSSGALGQVEITNTTPGLFAANADGQGVPAAVFLRVRADGSQSYEPVARLENNRFVPAPLDLGSAGEQVFLVLYGTGLRFRQTVSASVGGVNANVLFAGAVAGFAGLDQINLSLPRSLIGRGEMDVQLRVDGVAANTVRISVR
ncbi:MAG: putative Ig domain-containing protein [Blastocatellia bacterium]